MASSKPVSNPGQQSRGFMIAVIAILVAIAAVIAYFMMSNKPEERAIDDAKFTMTQQDNAFVLAADNLKPNTPVVDLYEDYSCTHCAQLHDTDHDDMLNALNDGKLALHIRSLAFMDETDGVDPKEAQTKASHQSLAALLAVAQSGDASLFWNYRDMLFQKQADVYHKFSPEDYAKLAADLGASEEVQQDIKDTKYLPDAQKVYKANGDKMKALGSKISSPTLYVGDKKLDLKKTGMDWISKVIDGKTDIYTDPKEEAAEEAKASEASASAAGEAASAEASAAATTAAQ